MLIFNKYSFEILVLQVLITIIVNILLLDVAFSYAFPTVVISALTGLNDKNNPNETIHLTGEQSSWLGET